MTETWRAIPGWEGYYEASDMGRIRSLPRSFTNAVGAPRTYPGRILTCRPQKHGRSGIRYHRAMLSRQSERRSVAVHSLIMETFVGPRPEGHEVAHNNGDSLDNRLSNLRYASRVENNGDKRAHGTHLRGSRIGNSVFTEEQVLGIVAARQAGESLSSIARRHNVSLSSIWGISKGVRWSWLTGISTVDHLEPEGDCSQHTTKQVAA